MEFLEKCRRFLAIDSTPSHGSADIANYAAELCREVGLHVEMQEGVLGGVPQANIIARPNSGRPAEEVLFLSHLDTVDPGSYSLWTMTDHNPFNATIRDGKIYGLGAADCKLDFLCKLEALKTLGNKNWRVPPVLVGSYGEELGLMGVRHLTKEHKVSAKRALVGAPSGLNLVYSCNGIVILEIRIPFSEEEQAYRQRHNEAESTSTHSKIFRGVAVHSSKPHLGENAVLKMVRYLSQLPETVALIVVDGGVAFNVVPDQAVLEIDLQTVIKNNVRNKLVKIVNEMESIAANFINFPSPDLEPPHPTYNIGPIRTNEDGIVLTFSIRVTPAVSEETLKQWQQKLKNLCDSMAVDLRLVQFLPAAKAAHDSEIIGACKSAMESIRGPVELRTVSATNETSVLNYRGISCVAVGPGIGAGNSHQPNEFNTITDLEAAKNFYVKTMERLCL